MSAWLQILLPNSENNTEKYQTAKPKFSLQLAAGCSLQEQRLTKM